MFPEIDLDDEGSLIILSERLAEAVALLDLLGAWLSEARSYLALPREFELRGLRDLRDLLNGLSAQLRRRALALSLARREAAGEVISDHDRAALLPFFGFVDVSRARWPEF